MSVHHTCKNTCITEIHSVDEEYERAGKRTYLLMLTLVGLFLPLLVGLLLLYPWIQERVKTRQQDQFQDREEDSECTELIPGSKLKHFRDSDD